MNPRIEQKIEALRKILLHEKERGYSDDAVFGGLDKFFNQWLEDPDIDLYFTQTGMEVPSYAELNETDRQDWVTQAISLLEPHNLKTPGPIPLHHASSSIAPQKTDQRSKTPPKTTRTKKKPTSNSTKPNLPISLETPLPTLPGIRKETLTKLKKIGIASYHDAITHYPYRHNDFSHTTTISNLVAGIDQTIHVTVSHAAQKQMGRKMRAAEITVTDDTGEIRVIWFNQPYLTQTFKPGTRLALSGKITRFRNRPVLENPEYDILSSSADAMHTGQFVPVYPLTEGLTQRTTRRIIRHALENGIPKIKDFVPPKIINRLNLKNRSQAIQQYHYPENELAKEQARVRLAFDELLLLQLGVLARRRDWHDQEVRPPIPTNQQLLKDFQQLLPFKLTGDQEKTLDEILQDMADERPMSRLLQGEVGSGKTVVATAASIMAAANGYQVALMAPTEVLAEQHFQTIANILKPASNGDATDDPYRGFSNLLDRPLRIALLVGSQTKKQKQTLHTLIKRGDVDIVIGTHALIQDEVGFANLGFAIVDEQQRFGVNQRAALRQKGQDIPHLLVMTATPIPRTLALTMYGDLDISTISELPSGRQEIKTRALKGNQRKAAYDFIRNQVQEGRQSFVICPLVEESEVIEARAAVAEHERLSQEIFPEFHLGLLHGRMKPQEKDAVLKQFRDGEVNILVSTAVVEVGIDVPNATVMLVDGADRFGLSQLHQYRGRVGRGQHQSYCMFLSESQSSDVAQRLETIERTLDGFELAEADLQLRGPGEFFGTRQSGSLDLKLAKPSDTELLNNAREEARLIYKGDPNLEKPEHASLKEEVTLFWRGTDEAPIDTSQ